MRRRAGEPERIEPRFAEGGHTGIEMLKELMEPCLRIFRRAGEPRRQHAHTVRSQGRELRLHDWV